MNAKDMLKRYRNRTPKPFNSIIENGDKADYFEGLDIEKPECLTPMEMELRIQADRVMFSLNKALSVLSVMAHLPFLMKDEFAILKENFSDREMMFIVYQLKLYETPKNAGGDLDEFCTSLKSPKLFGDFYDAVNKIKTDNKKIGMLDKHMVIDGHLSQLIDMIYTNRCIRQEIKNAQKPLTIPYLVHFIEDFEKLRDMAKIKLYVTGTEEEARDKQLRGAYKSNIMLTAAIKDLDLQLTNQRAQLGNDLSKKVAISEKYNHKIAKIREEFQISIEKNIHESERKMMQQCLESEEKQADLAAKSETISKQYETLMEFNLNSEKQLRAKTMKTQMQLSNWLTKYDQDVGEKQSEYENLKAEYDSEKAAMDDLEDKLDEQERLYNTLMAEKAEEEQRLFEEIAYKMLMTRSARIIQKAWRAYRERRSKRRGKKGKKGKDGKKSQGKK